jgi:hypothetical protein
MHQIPLLVGKTLGCWCKPNPCHGDVLVKLVREYLEEEEFKEEPDIDNEDDSAIDERFDYPERKECLWHNKQTEAQGLMEGIVIGITYMKRPQVGIMALSKRKLIRPLDCRRDFVRSDSLCRVGTKFYFSLDKRQIKKTSSLPHFREDVFVDISQIDSEPIDSITLKQLISSCAALQNTSAQQLLNALAANRQDATRTPYVFESDNLPSSVIIKVESDVMIYLEDGARHPRAQFQAQGHEFNLPVTSIGIIDKYFSGEKKEVTLKYSRINFVCVSLARPFLPWMSSHLSVARCYAMFTGVILFVDNEFIVL